jgi:exodeoxyribonuclease VII small subunit
MSQTKFSYNAAITEVEQILESFSQANLDVDELTRKVKRATELLQECKKKLYQTEVEIQAVFDQKQE